MKRLLIILLSALSLTMLAQQQKTVAVLDPICRDNSVNAFYQQMVRGSMESAVTASSEYEAYDRSAFDQIQKEQAFQRTGVVSDSQIKKMGEMAGVDYVLVSEVSAYEGYLSAIVKILNIETGKYDKSIDDYMQLSPDAVKTKCREMATTLFGAIPSGLSMSKKQVSSGFVDLGLPSGTLWKAENEEGDFFTYEQATSLFGSNLPTKEQWEELKNSCQWAWSGNGYKVMGPSRKSIFLPATGYRYENGQVSGVGTNGYYWSSTAKSSTYAWGIGFSKSSIFIGDNLRGGGRPIRLVK
jgi:hypothetical protein